MKLPVPFITHKASKTVAVLIETTTIKLKFSILLKLVST